MREHRIRVQIRLPKDLTDRMKKFLPTTIHGCFSGDAISIYIEMLIRDDIGEREKLELDKYIKENGSATS